MSAVYLDCNATTPVDPRIRDLVLQYLDAEYGNAGSRTHEYGTRAKQAVQRARAQIAAAVKCAPEEVVFTSGATESNNLALLGLAAHGTATGRRHVISTQIEHKAVLEPLAELEKRGFSVELLAPNAGGWIDPGQVAAALRPDTLLVSVMHANNETGVLQPIREIAEVVGNHPAYLHVDAAQTFGKVIEDLCLPRLDLISVSAHKLYGPKGVGALIARRRGYERPPLAPLMFGGGQERGLRPGTLAVPLVVGLGLAAELALKEHRERVEACRAFRQTALSVLHPLGAQLNGDQDRVLPHVLNLSIPGLDSEAVIVALKDIVAISNGSACTSASYTLSHVLGAMGLAPERIQGALRLSWCHMTPEPDWATVAARLSMLIGRGQ